MIARKKNYCWKSDSHFPLCGIFGSCNSHFFATVGPARKNASFRADFGVASR